MTIAARSPECNSASSRARARGSASSLKSEKVSLVRSRSRSDSIRQVSSPQRSSASRNAAPRELYWSRLSTQGIFDFRLPIHDLSDKNLICNRKLEIGNWKLEIYKRA